MLFIQPVPEVTGEVTGSDGNVEIRLKNDQEGRTRAASAVLSVRGASLSKSAPAEQSDLASEASHIARRAAVSSAFTCSSLQRGLCAAASAGKRGLKTCAGLGRGGAPPETTEAVFSRRCRAAGGERRGC